MTFHYPRRVKDLPALDPDSDDEYNTPQKQSINNKKEQNEIRNANKENEAEKSNNATQSDTKSSSSTHNMRMYPKRRAELPSLESDSEEDDNLNCAILNDSFIMSPAKSDAEETPGPQKKYQTRKHGNTNEEVLSFVTCFDKMQLNVDKDAEQAVENKLKSEDRLQHVSTVQRSNSKLHSISALQSIEENKCTEFETPFKGVTTNAPTTTTMTATTTTSSVVAEAQFVTPQVRPFSVQRRPRDLCSTQSQKTRTAIVNEFRTQKVLFQTPMAMTRAPPVACLSNDSIGLSLCDTINEIDGGGATPSTTEKSPPVKSETNQDSSKIKSKKSLEGAFSQASAGNSKSKPTSDSKAALLRINNMEYEIIKKLGCGGSSSVYLAQRKDNGKECALKVVDLRGDPAVVEGYLNETKLLAKLQGNVCVVALYEYELLQKESKLYVVMEKGDSDLHKILQGYTTNLPLYVLMNFLYQMLQAVNYIHQNGVIHSDLKPANFLMVNGRLKLIDFGIASNIALDSTSIIKYSQAGTFNYISPEALTDTSTGTSPMRNNQQPKIKISTKSDVWSLGCILYLLLYKKTPFSHIKNIYAKISAISNPKPSIEYPAIPTYYPIMLMHMVKNCLQHDPKKRPSCAELLQYPFNMIIPIHNLTIPSQSQQ